MVIHYSDQRRCFASLFVTMHFFCVARGPVPRVERQGMRLRHQRSSQAAKSFATVTRVQSGELGCHSMNEPVSEATGEPNDYRLFH